MTVQIGSPSRLRNALMNSSVTSSPPYPISSVGMPSVASIIATIFPTRRSSRAIPDIFCSMSHICCVKGVTPVGLTLRIISIALVTSLCGEESSCSQTENRCGIVFSPGSFSSWNIVGHSSTAAICA